ncbi:MAG: thioredoxin domain-containing protein [Microterricola sp.]
MTFGASPEPRPTKNQRREAAREKARELRVQQKKKDRRNKVLLQSGIAVGIVAVIAVISLIVVNSFRPEGPGPANMASDGILIGEGLVAVRTPALAADAKPIPSQPDESGAVADIRVWVDYLCPFCGDFERTNSEQIQGWLESGAATLEVHPLATQTSKSAGTKYSLRAANAAACVANYSPDDFFVFNSAMFIDQPQENTAALNNDEIKQRIKDAGVSNLSKINTCIDDEQFKGWVLDATDRALVGPLPNTELEKVSGTPTVLVNGKQYIGSLEDPKEFAAFVQQATGQTYSTSTPTPTPAPAG